MRHLLTGLVFIITRRNVLGVNTTKLTVEDVQFKDKVCHSCETINIADLGREIVWLLSAHVIELILQEKVIMRVDIQMHKEMRMCICS